MKYILNILVILLAPQIVFGQPASRFYGGAGQGYTMSDTGLDGIVLPVTWAGFTAKQSGDAIVLEWATSEEINNDYFDVQRAVDGINFETIGTVQGSGTTTERKSYEHHDRQPRPGSNYYRVMQVDYDGGSGVSEIRHVFYQPGGGKDQRIVCLINGHLYPVFIEKTDSELEFTLVNLMGQVLHREPFIPRQGYDGVDVAIGGRLPTGIYHIVITGSSHVSKKVLLR